MDNLNPDQDGTFSLPGRESVEIYRGKKGHICIKQSSQFGEDDAIVVLLPTDIDAVVSALQQLAIEE